MLEEIIIPKTITVHLGRPSSNAENVTVDFAYYLKNVASSEIYPTWPYEALKANIWAQMSLVLNRVYTEWYPTQGYNFDITNSTAFDQAFVKGRNIYDSVAEVVDEVIGDYLQKPYFLEPYYSEYCDGKKTSCPGLKQWGTFDLATRGYNAKQIIQYYYGNIMEFKHTDNVQMIEPSYPGTPIRLGDQGDSVFTIQELINGIGVNYPQIPLIYPPDAIFGPQTEKSVKAFQKQFKLTQDGIVGKATWNQLSRIYVAVRKLAELTSIGRLKGYFTGLWVGKILKLKSIGIEVQQLQFFLQVISRYNSNIPFTEVDSRFGPSLQKTVKAFQKEYGLIDDGVVGKATWNKVFQIYSEYIQES